MFVTHINHVFNIEVLSTTSNGSVNTGNVIAKGFSADVESVGGQSVIGTALVRPATNGNLNVVSDPDGIDQAQVQL